MNKTNNYSKMSNKELLFVLLHHLLQQNYHYNVALLHKKEAKYIQKLLNQRNEK